MLMAAPAATRVVRAGTPAPRRRSRHRRPRRTSPRGWVALICLGQILLANRPGRNRNAFEDEGLYVFIGHRMIDHVLHGAFLPEYPGKYFSGAPGLYPVLAAMGDAVGGLQGARTVSLLFALVATVAVYGLGRELFGSAAGVLGAAAFSLCGSVLFQSHFATYDAMAMGCVAVAAWLAVRSTKRDDLLWAPAVALLLALGFLAKYGVGVYVPVVAGLAVAVGWPRSGWTVAFRAVFVVVATGVICFFVIAYWGSDIVDGLVTTTFSRTVLDPQPRATLVRQTATWVGPWLALALVAGLLRTRRDWRVVGVLLAGAVVAPLEQIRIGEGESLAKHLAFGMVFASPLVGDLLARLLRARPGRLRGVAGVLAVATVLGSLGFLGVRYSTEFGTTWVDDRELIPVLGREAAAAPGKVILGEQPSPQRYALRRATSPAQWTDTYQFSYDGLVDQPAYVRAVQQSHFGVIYLSFATPNGRFLHDYLTTTDTPYVLDAQVNRYLHGRVVGKWLVYVPKVLAARRG